MLTVLCHDRDKVWLRSLVVFLVVANIVNSTFNTAFAYTALVAHYGCCLCFVPNFFPLRRLISEPGILYSGYLG
jgi:hypothetical protein